MKTQSLAFLPANRVVVQGIFSPLAIALGVALPHVFHLAGLGPVFLPMFLPLVLVAMTMELPFILLVAITTPLISHAMTGMPAQGTAIVIAFQLSFLGLCGWFFRTRGKMNYLWAIAGCSSGGTRCFVPRGIRLSLACFIRRCHRIVPRRHFFVGNFRRADENL